MLCILCGFKITLYLGIEFTASGERMKNNLKINFKKYDTFPTINTENNVAGIDPPPIPVKKNMLPDYFLCLVEFIVKVFF